MKKLLECVELSWVALKAQAYFFREEMKVRFHFYHCPLFRSRDRALKRLYRFNNPFRMNKAFLLSRGDQEVDIYGETPLTTLYQIALQCEISSKDHVFDLGCGRGRGVFFLHDLIGCRATGIDWNPFFIERAKQIIDLDPSNSLSFHCADLLDVDLSQATVIYLFGTCLSDPVIEQLIPLFSLLPPSTKFITASFPMSDYSNQFVVMKEWIGSFPWGKTSIFLTKRRAHSVE